MKDTGIGIDEKNVNKIFERFSQASADTTRLYGGTGLGLTICKFLVEGFGGTISVQSKLNQGTTFVFDAKFKKESNVNIKKEVDSTSNIIFENKVVSILLAEDVQINQKLMQKIAENWGFKIDIAENGEEALEKHKKNQYDIILMDIQMPIMNGFVTSIAIRQLDDIVKKEIPIIALTAHASNTEAEKCLNLGMNAYMSKPFDQLQLKQTILKLISKKEKIIEETITFSIPESLFFDLSQLYQNSNGDKEYLIDMFDTYIENIPIYLSELEHELKAKDIDLIFQIIHKIKSPLLLFGLKNVNEKITFLEENYKSKNIKNFLLMSKFQLKKCIF